jgi:hypothetical protein
MTINKNVLMSTKIGIDIREIKQLNNSNLYLDKR